MNLNRLNERQLNDRFGRRESHNSEIYIQLILTDTRDHEMYTNLVLTDERDHVIYTNITLSWQSDYNGYISIPKLLNAYTHSELYINLHLLWIPKDDTQAQWHDLKPESTKWSDYNEDVRT